jgi:hypothetical protein
MAQLFPGFAGATGNVTASFFRRVKTCYRRCLAPGMLCGERAIEAHSVQNSRVLDAISEAGHVYMFTQRISSAAGFEIRLQRVGRNRATTFSGLCAKHDTRIFSRIDTEPLLPLDPEKCFLLAYRAALREHHTKLAAAVATNSAYDDDALTRGYAKPELGNPLFMAAFARIGESYNFYRFKVELDRWLRRGRWAELQHNILRFVATGPVLAVSSTYSHIDNMSTLRRRLEPVFIMANVFPHGDDTYAVFSFKRRQRADVLPHLEPLLTAAVPYQRYLISKMLLARCENLLISPRRYAALDPQTIEVMEAHFAATIRHPDKGLDDPRLMLL